MLDSNTEIAQTAKELETTPCGNCGTATKRNSCCRSFNNPSERVNTSNEQGPQCCGM